MGFTKVNTAGWYPRDTLTSAQINQIDTNISNGVDIRSGATNAIQSDMTFIAGTTTTFDSGATLVINVPEDVTIANGTLTIDCQIIGDTLPLRFGLATEALTGSTYPISSNGQIKSIIVLTGILTTDVQVQFPATTTAQSYFKLIDNQCTTANGSKISITTTDFTSSGVYIPNEKTGLVWVGSGGCSVLAEPANKVDSIFFKSESASYGTIYQTFTTGSSVAVTGYKADFVDVVAGDQFEISYTAGLSSAGSSDNILLEVNTSLTGFIPSSATLVTGTTEIVQSINTLYTAVSSVSTFYIELRCTNSISNGYIRNPLSFTVKKIIG